MNDKKRHQNNLYISIQMHYYHNHYTNHHNKLIHLSKTRIFNNLTNYGILLLLKFIAYLLNPKTNKLIIFFNNTKNYYLLSKQLIKNFKEKNIKSMKKSLKKSEIYRFKITFTIKKRALYLILFHIYYVYMRYYILDFTYLVYSKSMIKINTHLYFGNPSIYHNWKNNDKIVILREHSFSDLKKYKKATLLNDIFYSKYYFKRKKLTLKFNIN